MEEIARQLNEILRAKADLEKRLEVEAEQICAKMHDLLFPKSGDCPSATPQQVKKKKRLTAIIDTEDEESFLQRKSKSPNTTRSGRPGRAAKARAESFLKEPDIRSKMRQKPDFDNSSTSIASTASIEILNNKPPVHDLCSSDEERDEFRMPPPKIPSLKSKKIVIKTEKISLGKSEVDSSTLLPSEPSIALTSASSSSATSTSTEPLVADVSAKSKPKKHKHHQPIKVERMSEVFVDPASRTRAKSDRISKKNSMESVYEDALAGPYLPVTQKVDQAPISNETMVCNATMTMGPNTTITIGPNAPANLGSNATITLPNNPSLNDATFQVNETVNICNATTVISKNIEQSHSQAQRTSSNLMTEESEDDDDIVPLVNKTKKNELFNPCVQSPVKKKVEAFEKAALESPAIRQGRPKTRQATKKPKENMEPNHTSTFKGISSSKIGGTSSLIAKPVFGRFLTPTQSSNLTPLIGQVKKAPNTTSKLMNLPKSTLTSSASAKAASNENIVEELNSGLTRLQQAADEKRKKREQKQQQAALVREMKEKERLEKLDKIRKKDEEKCKPKATEIKSKSYLDEIQRNLKLAAEKEEQKKRIEKQKLEMAESARKEREHLKELRKKNEEMRELEMKRKEQQKIMKMKPQTRVLPKYNFDMLHSDDSTDEEGKVSHKRPYPPPSWSLERNRGAAIDQQAFLSTKIIDSLFSVQPMSVNLEEIFPTIDKKYLKRNSSVIWKTPPRYSEMPKY